MFNDSLFGVFGGRRAFKVAMPRMSGEPRSLDSVSLREAASAAVTNRSNMSSFAPLGSQARAVNEHKALAEICQAASVNDDEARTAAREAVSKIGGHIERRSYPGGLAAGRMRVHHRETWWVPVGALC
jgi:hypothetical protein